MIETSHLAKPRDTPAPRWFHVAVAASMVISALAALIGTLHTGQTMTALVERNAKLVRAGSTPILEFDHGNVAADGTSTLEFNVRNVGTGLARIVWLELSIDGRVMPDLSSAVRELKPLSMKGVEFLTNSIAPRTLAAGSDIQILGWRA